MSPERAASVLSSTRPDPSDRMAQNARPLPERVRPEAPVAVSTRCQGCGACLLTCPTHAIRPHGNPLLVLADRCTGCLECLDVCPVDAIDLLGPADHPLESSS